MDTVPINLASTRIKGKNTLPQDFQASLAPLRYSNIPQKQTKENDKFSAYSWRAGKKQGPDSPEDENIPEIKGMVLEETI